MIKKNLETCIIFGILISIRPSLEFKKSTTRKSCFFSVFNSIFLKQKENVLTIWEDWVFKNRLKNSKKSCFFQYLIKFFSNKKENFRTLENLGRLGVSKTD